MPSSEADTADAPSAGEASVEESHADATEVSVTDEHGEQSAEDSAQTDDDEADEEAEAKIEGIPEGEELEEIAGDLDDIEAVLKNLDKDNADFDAACAAAEADGTISERPALDAYWQAKSQSA